MITCDRADLEVVGMIQTQVNGDGTISLDLDDLLQGAKDTTIELYTCNNCLEQFAGTDGGWQEALEHLGKDK